MTAPPGSAASDDGSAPWPRRERGYRRERQEQGERQGKQRWHLVADPVVLRWRSPARDRGKVGRRRGGAGVAGDGGSGRSTGRRYERTNGRAMVQDAGASGPDRPGAGLRWASVGPVGGGGRQGRRGSVGVVEAGGFGGASQWRCAKWRRGLRPARKCRWSAALMIRGAEMEVEGKE